MILLYCWYRTWCGKQKSFSQRKFPICDSLSPWPPWLHSYCSNQVIRHYNNNLLPCKQFKWRKVNMYVLAQLSPVCFWSRHLPGHYWHWLLLFSLHCFSPTSGGPKKLGFGMLYPIRWERKMFAVDLGVFLCFRGPAFGRRHMDIWTNPRTLEYLYSCSDIILSHHKIKGSSNTIFLAQFKKLYIRKNSI